MPSVLCAVTVILMFKRSPCGPAVDDKGLQPAIDKHDASAQNKSVEFNVWVVSMCAFH